MGDNYPSDWNSRRKKVYKYDNYQCQECGAKGGKHGNSELHAHHIKPISEGGSHEYSNLRTLCKSCHSDVHGHAVGGSTSSDSSDEVDPIITAISFVIVGIAVLLAVTYVAVVQVLPAGQAVSEEYRIEYGTVTDDSDGYGQDYNDNVGSALILRYELSDNVISENQKTQLRVTLYNPSENRLEGQLEVIGETNYQYKVGIATPSFELSPGETGAANLTIPGEIIIADSGVNRRTTNFNARATIWNDSYMEISTDRTGYSDNKINLEVRKPLWKRPGLYWLVFLGMCLSGGIYLFWRIYNDKSGLL